MATYQLRSLLEQLDTLAHDALQRRERLRPDSALYAYWQGSHDTYKTVIVLLKTIDDAPHPQLPI